MSSLFSTRSTVSPTVTSSVTTAASPTSSLTILLHSRIEGTSDFFPFDDIASLGSSSRGHDSFSFRDLIEDNIGGGQQILLFDRGCHIDGEPDCSRACHDPRYFFSSLETFYNCAALASISYWTHDVNSYYVSAEAEANASSIMGGGTLDGFDGGPVLDSFIMCAQASCDTDGLARPCDGSVDDLSTNTSTVRDILDAMDTFCPDIAAEINPDIFGPGVLISYVLQVCFSASLYLFLKAFTFYVEYTQKPKKRTQEKRLRRTLTLNRIRSTIWPDSSALSRTSVAVATTLVEFQEAQCWFVFAVQIASILAIVVNSQEGTFWGEIIMNAGVAYHVSLNGILPMFLVQICLHNEGIRNWHTFIGFGIEWVLAIVAASQNVRFKDAFELFRDQNAISACGGNPSPRTYCAATLGVDGLQLSFFPHPLLYKMVFLVLDTIAILVLTVDQLAWTLRKHRWTKHRQIAGCRLGRWPDRWERSRTYWAGISKWFWRLLEAAYLVINILYMVSLIKVINAESFAANRWSYGQIIAVTVWGPVIVKLFDLILSGPPKNGMRLHSGPPRLRIDNAINHRTSMSTDESVEIGEFTARRKAMLESPMPPSRTVKPDEEHQIEGESFPGNDQEEGIDPLDSATDETPRTTTLRFDDEPYKPDRGDAP